MPLNVEPLENISLAEKAYRLLKRQIIEGRLAPGEKLDIVELSEELRVSRTPVKEAFNRLAVDGLLTIHPQRGTFVTTFGAEDVDHVFEARLMFELWAARRGVEHPQSLNFDKMKAALDQCESLLESEEEFEYTAYINGDMAFHTAIVEAAQNPRVTAMYGSLHAHIHAMRVYWGRAYQRAVKSHQEHEEIFKALKNGRYPEIRKTLTRHIVRSKTNLLSLLREDTRFQSEPGKRRGNSTHRTAPSQGS